ncbi:hypothetical protein AMS68_006952 [Peltaster fructicola]|uniref:Uncharacterized protein n=1 Tax=Peltaster fructicola TaxID=286661 RepID=A0A6H0Y3C3_9PEZI|nr:hypothetical protein AMS68_006952 [Peltaster fructicola]
MDDSLCCSPKILLSDETASTKQLDEQLAASTLDLRVHFSTAWKLWQERNAVLTASEKIMIEGIMHRSQICLSKCNNTINIAGVLADGPPEFDTQTLMAAIQLAKQQVASALLLLRSYGGIEVSYVDDIRANMPPPAYTEWASIDRRQSENLCAAHHSDAAHLQRAYSEPQPNTFYAELPAAPAEIQSEAGFTVRGVQQSSASSTPETQSDTVFRSPGAQRLSTASADVPSDAAVISQDVQPQLRSGPPSELEAGYIAYRQSYPVRGVTTVGPETKRMVPKQRSTAFDELALGEGVKSKTNSRVDLFSPGLTVPLVSPVVNTTVPLTGRARSRAWMKAQAAKTPRFDKAPTASKAGWCRQSMMSAQQWEPDVVVGIDFGMTCTGVAWSSGPDWPDPKTIQRWPGRLSHELRNKVDTCVSYDGQTGELAAWGFLCNPDDEKFEFNELFKLYLDPDYKDASPDSPSMQDARTWFRDYLSCLHKYINRYFQETMPRFEQKRTEYVFSVPTTWKDPAMIAEIEKSIKHAGFGQLNKERASIYLTEAEAAAVYTSKQSLEVGDVFLVCDIGGGTTDLNVLKVKSAAAGQMELIPLSWAEGQAVGSTIIDFKVQDLIHERLARVRPAFADDLDLVAARMTQQDFMRFKCSLGSEHADRSDLLLPVPGLAPGYSSDDARIHDSKVVLSLSDLQSTFDGQIETLCELIDHQLHIVQSKSPKENISFLVLSGGLSNSAYVQQRIRARYEKGAGVAFRNAKNMRFLIAGEPQLAVVHGLVTARIQSCKGGRKYLTKRCSPVSYGIVSRQPYDPALHVGQPLVRDQYDQRQWAADQITWIIKRGEVLDLEKGASQMYQMRLSMGEEKLPWRTRIAMSTAEADRLPRNIHEQSARIICEVEFELNVQDFKMKNRHWYQMKQPYYTGQFEVRLLLGVGLQFQVWAKDRLLSKEHEQIQIEWVPAGALPTAATADDGNRMYKVVE